jgi:hypothetical protein
LSGKTFGDAIRAFYGLKDKGNSAAKGEEQPAKRVPKNESPTSAPTEQQPEPQRVSEGPLLAKVRIRLKESKISEPEFLDILRCAQIAEAAAASSLADISDKTLELALGS